MAIEYGDGSDSNSGRVIQVVSVTDTAASSRESGTSGTWYDFGSLSANITPSDSNNKILVMAHCTGHSNYDGAIRLNRSGTVISVGAASGSRLQATVEFMQANRSNEAGTHSFFYLDSPGTTSQRNYKVQYNYRSQSIYINRSVNDDNATHDSRTTSSLTLMEIAA